MPFYALVTALLFSHSGQLPAQENSLPLVGAQVFIEPGQKHSDVDHWFRLLKESGMTALQLRDAGRIAAVVAAAAAVLSVEDQGANDETATPAARAG